MIRFVALFMALFLGAARAAELPPPTTNPSLAGNIGGVWYGAGFTFSNCTGLSTGTITCNGVITSYPAAGIVQSTGSAWGTSITPGTGVVTALGNPVNAASGLLTFSGAFGTPTSLTLTNATGLPYTALPALSANQVLGALTGTTPSGLTVNSCSAAGSALLWTSGTGFGCATGYLTSAGAVTTFSAGSTGLTPNSATSGAVTLAGTLAAGSGGTGISTSASTGVAQVSGGAWSVSTALANGTTATTQTGADNTAKAATDTYVDTESGLVSTTTVSGLTGGSTTLTAAQYAPPNIILTGALTSAQTIVMPNNGRWTVTNNTTGPWLVTFKTSAGTGIQVSQGYTDALLANGTNVVDADNDYYQNFGFTNSGSGALDAFYACLRYSTTGVCHIVSFADSIETCYQITPCTYGPFNGMNSPTLAFRNEFLKQYTQYGTGLRVPFRLMPTATVDGGEGGYTLTSGSVANAASNTYGPGQTGYSLNGQALLQASSGAVISINVGQGFRQVNIYCVETASSNGWTVTVGGTSLGTACGSTSGSTIGLIQSFNNTALTTATSASWAISGTTLTVTTVATGTFATGGVLSGTSVTGGTTILSQMTGTSGGIGTYNLSASSTASSGTLTQTGGLVNSTFTLTALGANSFLGGYEAVTTTGTTGVEVDNMGEGAISSAFWTSNTNALGWFNLIAAQSGHRIGMCIHSGGENDAQNPTIVTPAQVVTNFQTVATACQNAGASFSLHIPTPYQGSTVNQYAWIQTALWNYGAHPTVGQPWDMIVLSDAFAGSGVNGVSQTGGQPNFIAQDTAASVAADVAAGLINAADSQHPTDYGSCLIIKQEFNHYSGGRVTFPCYWQPQVISPQNTTTLATAYTNATTGFITICEGSAGACAAGSHPFQFTVGGNQLVHFRCHMVLQVSAAATLSMTIAGSSGTPQILSQRLITTPTLTTPGEAIIRTATYGTADTSASLTTTATDLGADYYVTVQHAATANAIATLSIQAHPSTGTLTIQPGSMCIEE